MGVTDVPPDQFCLDGFEGCFNRHIILEISRSTDRRLQPVLAQDLLVVVRAILAATVGGIDVCPSQYSECEGHLQLPDCWKRITARYNQLY